MRTFFPSLTQTKISSYPNMLHLYTSNNFSEDDLIPIDEEVAQVEDSHSDQNQSNSSHSSESDGHSDQDQSNSEKKHPSNPSHSSHSHESSRGD